MVRMAWSVDYSYHSDIFNQQGVELKQSLRGTKSINNESKRECSYTETYDWRRNWEPGV